MRDDKGTSLLFTNEEKVTQGASWHQHAKARNRKRRTIILGKSNEAYQQDPQQEDEALKQLEQKIHELKNKDIELKQEHKHLPEAKGDFDNEYDDFEDEYLTESFRKNRSAYNDNDE